MEVLSLIGLLLVVYLPICTPTFNVHTESLTLKDNITKFHHNCDSTPFSPRRAVASLASGSMVCFIDWMATPSVVKRTPIGGLISKCVVGTHTAIQGNIGF